MRKPITVIGLIVGAAFVAWAGGIARAEIAPYPAAPLCPTHDDRAYHGLWDAARGCHYNHTHGDNPHELDGLFGTEIYSWFGGEISYPWQTFSASGTENQLKHEGYYWIVRSNIPCPANATEGCVTDFRLLMHMHADGHDTGVRYHSYFVQKRVCPNPNNSTQNGCGIATSGGWQDTGDLLVNGNLTIDVPGNGNCHKQHRSTDGMAVWYPCQRWGLEGPDGLFRESVAIHNEWDRTSTDPAQVAVYTDTVCYPNPRCTSNGTFLRPHLIQLDIPANPIEDLFDPDNNNIVESFNGFTTPYGVVDPACTEVSAVCVPLQLTNIRTNLTYAYRDTDPGRSYDVWFCGGVQCTMTSPGRVTSNWAQPHH